MNKLTFDTFWTSIKKFALQILVSTLAIYISSLFFDSIQITHKFTTSVQVAIVLSIFNTYLKPLLVMLTIPLTIFTLGVFLIVINAVIILLIPKFVPDFHILNGFWTAFWFSIVLSIMTSILEGFGGNFKVKVIKKDKHDKFDDYEEVD